MDTLNKKRTLDSVACDKDDSSAGASEPQTKKCKLEPERNSTIKYSTAVYHNFVKSPLGLNVTYYARFFGRREADAVFKELESELKPYFEASRNEIKIMGKVCKIPRKQTAFGDNGLKYSFSGITLPACSWIPSMYRIKQTVEEALGENFNFVLVNRYKDGSDSIGEHRDDEVDLVANAPIASLSFGQSREFIFKHKDSRGKNAPRKDIQPVKIHLEHGSLLVMKYPTNTFWYHSLPARKQVMNPRINLTFRKMKVKEEVTLTSLSSSSSCTRRC